MARTGLGKGLGALIGTPPTATRPDAIESGERVHQINLANIVPNALQPRKDFGREALQELIDSIRQHGIIQPLIVRQAGARFELIAGERRWRAAQMAGLSEIPAVIRHIPDEAAIAVALIENIQRENLNPLEEARALERLVSEFGLTHQEVAQAVGRSRAGVSNLLRLLELTAEVGELLEKRTLEMGHARALLGLTERRRQTEVALLVARKGLSVRETEALVRRLQAPPGAGTAPEDSAGDRDPNVARLEQELAEKLGARVAIQAGRGGRGKLVVSYNSLDELDGILAHIQ
jgi:ParB family chromosome partitioning protein